MLRAYKTPIFAKGQKLTHTPAHEEKHAGQEHHYTTLTNASTGLLRQGEELITCTQVLPGLLTLTPTHATWCCCQ